jgi:hypothetical protein
MSPWGIYKGVLGVRELRELRYCCPEPRYVTLPYPRFRLSVRFTVRRRRPHFSGQRQQRHSIQAHCRQTGEGASIMTVVFGQINIDRECFWPDNEMDLGLLEQACAISQV